VAASRRAHVVWLILGTVLAVASIGWGSINVVSALAHEEYTQRRIFDAAIRVLDVRIDSGSLTVERSPSEQTTVIVHVSEGLEHPEPSFRVIGDRLVIRSSCSGVTDTFCSADFRVRVPAGTAVDAETEDAGIRVAGVGGPVDLVSRDGGITVDGAEGPVRLSSRDGSVDATNLDTRDVRAEATDGSVHLSLATAPRTVDARTVDGSVTVEVPDTPVAYRVDTDVTDGATDVAVRTDPTGARRITAHATSGDVTVRYRS
jgi:hypothetical protein